MPIPSIQASDSAFPGSLAPVVAERSTRMKPDPQSGGMNLPGFSMPPSMNYSAPSSSGNTTSQAASPQRNPTRQASDDPLLRIARPDSSNSDGGNQRNRGGTNSLNAYTNATGGRFGNQASSAGSGSGNTADARSGVPSNSVQGRLTSGNQGVNRNEVAGPTDTTNRSGVQDDRSWYDARGVPPRRPSTDPVDGREASSSRSGTVSGRASGNNFAQLPNGLRPTAPANRVDYDPRLSSEQAARLPRNGYTFARDGTPLDREGYPLDRYGNRVATPNGERGDGSSGRLSSDDFRSFPASANSQSGGQNATNQYSTAQGNGSPNNSAGRSFSGFPGTGSELSTPRIPSFADGGNFRQTFGDNTSTLNGPFRGNGGGQPAGNWGSGMPTGNASYPESNQYSQAFDRPSFPYATNPGARPASQVPGRNFGAAPRNAAPRNAAPPNGATAGTGDPRLASRSETRQGSGQGRAAMEIDDATPSPSDHTVGRDASSFGSGSYAASGSRPERVAAQPIFNGLLLCSVIVNVYLLFWLKNLRVQFREMVAAKRSASSGGIATVT